ncbi:MAG: ATP-binding protein [Elusimicrobiota bacterium]
MADYFFLVFVLGISGWLSVKVYERRSNNPANRVFAFFIWCVWVWALCNFLQAEISNNLLLRILFGIDFFAAIFAAYFILIFCLSFPTSKINPKTQLALISPIIFLGISSFTKLIITDVTFEIGKQAIYIPGPLFPLYAVVHASYVFIGIGYLFYRWRNLTGLAKVQVTYILLGLSIFCVIAIFVNLILAALFPIPVFISRIGIYGIFPLTAFPAYAMIRYRLMDAKLMVRATGHYLLTTGILSFFFAILIAAITNNFKISFFSFLIFLLLPALQKQLSNRIGLWKVQSGLLNRGQIKQINSISDRIKNSGYKISELAQTVGEILLDSFPVSNCAIYIMNDSGTHFSFEAPSQFKMKFPSQILQNDSLTKRLENYQRDLINTVEFDLLIQTKSTIAVPFIVLDRVVGFILMGEKEDKKPFFTNEINELSFIANETSVALRYVLAVSKAASETKQWAHNMNQYLKPLAHGFNVLADIDPHIAENPVKREVYQRIQRPLNRLADFLYYLTHQSRMIDESLRNRYHLSLVDLEEIIDKGVFSYRFSLDKKNIYYDRKMAIPKQSIMGHTQDLISLFEGLTSNAVRYTPINGTIKVRSKINGETIEIQYENDGPSIPTDNLSQIFNEGFQIKNGFEGTAGLGLANTKRIIEMHGATIEAENIDQNQGVRFTMRFPYKK